MSAGNWQRRIASTSCQSSSGSYGYTDNCACYFDMTGLHGWTVGALWEDTKFATRHFSDIDRLAVVGEKKWQEEMATFCKPFTKATVRYFDHAVADEARKWLGEA